LLTISDHEGPKLRNTYTLDSSNALDDENSLDELSGESDRESIIEDNILNKNKKAPKKKTIND